MDRPIIACETSLARSVTVDTVASGLDTPWDVAFLSDGTALFTERGGRIRSINPGGALDPVSWAVVPVIEDSERGLFGIDVLSAEDGQVAVYVAGTFQYLGGSRLSRVIRRVGRRIARAIDSERGHGTYLEVLRIPSMNRRAGVPESVVSGIPSAALHAGGALRFGPDGFLYVGTGEAMEGWSAQDLTTTRGKVLRYGSDGSIPLTNPYPGSPIFALGFRNVQGLDWHPSTQELFAVEHGPTGAEREGFRTDDDELNLIEPGLNYGWPIVTGGTSGGELASPIGVWTTAIGPASLAIAPRSESAWSESVFVTGLRSADLRRVELEQTDGRWTASCEETLFAATYGRLRLARMAPDGSLWIGTSNSDQRGIPRANGDLILRVRLAEPSPVRTQGP